MADLNALITKNLYGCLNYDNILYLEVYLNTLIPSNIVFCSLLTSTQDFSDHKQQL